MRKILCLALVMMLTLVVVYATEKVPANDPFKIEGEVVDKETGAPIEARLVFAAQLGDELIQHTASCLTSKKGTFTLVLPKKPEKEAGNYALLVVSVTDEFSRYTGRPMKMASSIYVTRYAPVEIPDTGNVCVMPVIEMSRVKFDEDWPYELPAKLIHMEDSLKAIDCKYLLH